MVVFNIEWYHHAGPRTPVPRLHSIYLGDTGRAANLGAEAARVRR